MGLFKEQVWSPPVRGRLGGCGTDNMQHFRIVMLALAVMLTANFAHADDMLPLPPDPPAQAQNDGPVEPSVHAPPPRCLQWSDRCVQCRKGDDGAVLCSNIGPACQPDTVQCIQTAPDDEPKADPKADPDADRKTETGPRTSP